MHEAFDKIAVRVSQDCFVEDSFLERKIDKSPRIYNKGEAFNRRELYISVSQPSLGKCKLLRDNAGVSRVALKIHIFLYLYLCVSL